MRKDSTLFILRGDFCSNTMQKSKTVGKDGIERTRTIYSTGSTEVKLEITAIKNEPYHNGIRGNMYEIHSQ